jgi:hypothetical protein
MGSYHYVPSWLALKADATQGMRWAILICIREPPGVRRPGSPSQLTWYGGQVVKSHPSMLNHRVVE